MNNTKRIKLISVITILSLIFGTMVGINISAADETASAEVDVTVESKNILYNEYMHIAIHLENNEVLNEGETLGILVWDYTVTGTPTVENATHKSFAMRIDAGGTTYYASHGIPAPDMAKDIRIAGCIKDADGNIKMGTVITYSIYEYLNNRLATEGISDLQRDLYKKTLAYGKAAGAVFAE